MTDFDYFIRNSGRQIQRAYMGSPEETEKIVFGYGHSLTKGIIHHDFHDIAFQRLLRHGGACQRLYFDVQRHGK